MTGEFQQQQGQQPNMPLSNNHGGHELFDVHEVLSSMIGALNQCVLLRDKIQDPELLSIMDRQYAFMLDEYNITVEAYKTGHDPKHPTRSYNMQTDNDFTYGITPGEPKKPMQSANEIDDSIIAGFMLAMHKAGAKGKTAAALETCNPVLRRVLQDSVPNCVEMAYEVSIYQNKKGNYQVPQLSPTDMQAMLNMYGQGQMAKNMPN
ncbi:spore coat protein [Solibacillus sp. CAU 1738]|uniref:spore coat protein n=1 Tax=Solibacillus sp. CAU 1738 TaxID=3140363 RepID=UPI00326095DE